MQANTLMAVPLTFLNSGVTLKEDIYGYDGTRLLVKSGTYLNDEKLGKLKKLNRGYETIYVTGSTYRELIDEMAIARREALEESTGYADTKQETLTLLDAMAKHKEVEPKALVEVSVDLSRQLKTASSSTIFALINALAPVDEYLQRHSLNTGLMNGLIGRWLELDKDAIDRLVLIGLLHDCGKALMPPSILNAPRKLTIVEYQVIKAHTVKSYELLGDFPEEVRLAARYHHEKADGTGYPDGLGLNDLPLEARITAVSDIYDAMVSQRAYKPPRSPFNVMAFLQKLSGPELDSGLVDLFLQNMPLELMDKEVMLSDGMMGIVRAFDVADIEYPTVEIGGKLVKTSGALYCTSMF